MRRCTALLVPVLLASACGADPEPAAAPSPGDAFWTQLAAMCGEAYAGEVVESVPADTSFRRPLVMHVRECGDSVIRIPFHVGDDRSRTWVFTRTAEGLRLKHDHRHRDGTPDEVTQYGGDTRDAGTASRQEFAADAHTAGLIPEASTNVWTVELVPGERFSYMLRREGTERRFRADFDLSAAVPAPPAPWGAESDPDS